MLLILILEMMTKKLGVNYASFANILISFKIMDWFKGVLKSPKYILAPMVDQSELAWRVMARRYGAHLCYTPMINARLFVENPAYRKEHLPDETFDRPLIVQFCANDAEMFLAAARLVQDKCDGVDLNLGCPQDIARRGHYGSYLQEEWDLISKMISIVAKGISVPITAKIRIFPSVEKSVKYAQMIESAGASLLTVHGRIREQRGHATGLADWAQIKAIKEALSIPVIANGNILYFEDIEKCISETRCDGVMCAETQLYNPALFSGKFIPARDLALEYLDICEETLVPSSSILRSHLFKIFKHLLPHHTDLRESLATAPDLLSMREISKSLGERLTREDKEDEFPPYNFSEFKRIPLQMAQPYIRPLPDLSKMPKKRKLLQDMAWAN